MPDLLLELFSEEIPARMQARASEDLKRLVIGKLREAGIGGFTDDEVLVFTTPRRLALTIPSVRQVTTALREERKGPRVGAPQKAIEGFLKSAGLTSIDQAEVQESKKGAFYVARTEIKLAPPEEALATMIPEVIRKFPWPKSMRWGEGSLRWVRPLHSILCLFGAKPVAFEVDGIKSGNITFGHRFMSDGKPIKVSGFEDYVAKLAKAHVVLDPAVRRKVIWDEAEKLAKKAKLELVKDEALLGEVAGLVEWPVMLMGRIDDDFMDVPQEVLTSTMRANQKYFALRDPKTGKLAPRFIVAANLAAQDGGKAIVNGNERVLRARFADAKFLWDEDRKHTLESRLEKLKGVTFYEKLGSMHEKAERISNLSATIVELMGEEREIAAKARQAGLLAKADLVTGMVYEFPELQGIMGRYYALNDGLDAEIADAIAEHYAPAGPSDDVPASPIGKVVALADKLDTLTRFWDIDEKPTGSKDPFALRRAALGVIRIVLEADLRLPLLELFRVAEFGHEESEAGRSGEGNYFQDLLSFFADRLKVHLRDQGARHDLVDAVFALEDQDDLVLIVKRVEALSDFLATEDGANLLAGYKRATNILKIEEKKDKRAYQGEADPALFAQDEERALFDRIEEARAEAEHAVGREDFAAAMAAMASLRAPVDDFFDKVTVNADKPDLRENRLFLLSQIRSALHQVADFSKIEG